MSHLGAQPPASSTEPDPKRTGAGPGLCGWAQRPTGRPWLQESEGHTQQRVSSSSDSSGSGEAPDTTGNVGSHRLAQRHRNSHPETLGLVLALGSVGKDTGRARLRLPARSFSRRDVALRAVTMAKWSNSHFGLRPLQHHDRSLPLYKPSPTGSQPRKRPGLLEAGPGSRPGGTSSRGEPSTRPGRNRSQPRDSAQRKSGKLSIDREEGSPRQAPQGAGHALEGRGRVINGSVT